MKFPDDIPLYFPGFEKKRENLLQIEDFFSLNSKKPNSQPYWQKYVNTFICMMCEKSFCIHIKLTRASNCSRAK